MWTAPEPQSVTYAHPDDAPLERSLVVDASASEEGLRLALASTVTEGEIVVASWFGDRPVSLPLGGDFHSRRLTIRSSQVGMVSPRRRGVRTPADRLGNHGERAPAYRAALAEYCSTQTWDELMRQMERTGMAICPVASPADAVSLAHVAARDMVERIEHPDEGEIPQFVNPLWRSGLARKQHLPAPALGQHTHEILQSLGYSSAEISRLSTDHVVEG